MKLEKHRDIIIILFGKDIQKLEKVRPPRKFRRI